MSAESAPSVDGTSDVTVLQSKIVRLAKAVELLMRQVKNEQAARQSLEEQVLLTQARVDDLEEALETVEDRLKQYEKDSSRPTPSPSTPPSRPFFDRNVATLPISTPSKAKALYQPERVKKQSAPEKIEPKRVRGDIVKMEGMLSKKGGKRTRGWKTRRFVLLETGALLYYKIGEKENDELLGEIHLKDCSSAEYMREKKYFGFVLTTSENVFHLRAPTEDSMVTWMHEILAILKPIQQQTKQNREPQSSDDRIHIPQPATPPSSLPSKESAPPAAAESIRTHKSTSSIGSAKEKDKSEKKSRFGRKGKKEDNWSPETTPDTIHYGPLHQMDGKKWKLYYFMVEYEKLHIFKSSKDESPSDTVEMYGSYIKAMDPVVEKNKETRYSFVLSTRGKKSFHLSSFSKEDVDYWKECMVKGSKPRTRLM